MAVIVEGVDILVSGEEPLENQTASSGSAVDCAGFRRTHPLWFGPCDRLQNAIEYAVFVASRKAI